jgi:DAK2 domain fusion protein YloV
VLQVLDGAAVQRWCAVALEALTAARVEIDDLNVYPVPDGDTGTNLQLTMQSVAEAVQAGGTDLATVTQAMSHAALMGARGNSGVILSQLLRGVAEVLGPLSTAGPDDLRAALRRGADLAYAAVAEPVEGTVLTCARGAADAATAHAGGLAGVVRAACDGAREALARTPSLLPVLAQAGVVDAGGRGLCVLLDALCSAVTGERTAPVAPSLLVPRDRSGLVAAREAGSDEYAYEVQFLLDADDGAVATMKQTLATLGDSLVVVGGDGLWNVHVHVNDVGAAVEAGVETGRPHRITVTRFADQIAAEPTPSALAEGRGVVVVAPGPGLVQLFESAGAVVVCGGPTANPSTAEILAAVQEARTAQVVVLPNDRNVHAAASHAAAAAADLGIEVHVVPTRSPVQGLAALAVHDPAAGFADDAIAMTNAATATRWAEVTVAVRDAQTMAGPCVAGDVLGLIDGDVVVIGSGLVDVAADVVERMLASTGELVTVVTGADLPADAATTLVARIGASRPTVEVEVHDGGQPHYPLLLGVE